MFLLGIILGIFIGILITVVISIDTINNYERQNTRIINNNIELIKENAELKDEQNNTESKVTQFARIIKKVEDITASQKSKEDKFDEIKELVTDGKSEN